MDFGEGAQHHDIIVPGNKASPVTIILSLGIFSVGRIDDQQDTLRQTSAELG